MGNGGLDGRHVARQATSFRAHRANGMARFYQVRRRRVKPQGRCGGMTRRDILLRRRRPPSRRYGADRGKSSSRIRHCSWCNTRLQVRVVPGNRTAIGSLLRHLLDERTMTLCTVRQRALPEVGPGPGDRQIGNLECDRRQVISPGPMASFAADPPVGSLGTGLFIAAERATVVWQNRQLSTSSALRVRPRSSPRSEVVSGAPTSHPRSIRRHNRIA